MIVKIQVPT